MEDLAMKLSKYGTVQICKAGKVFTLLMTGENMHNMNKHIKIADLLESYVFDKYETVEVIRNSETFFCMVLTPSKERIPSALPPP